MMSRRLLALFIVFVLLFVQVTLRLYTIAADEGGEFLASAQRQQQMELVLCERGGLITDINGLPLNYEEGVFAALVQPEECRGLSRTAMLLASACDLTTREVLDYLEKGSPFSLTLERPVEAPGVTVLPCLTRSETPPAVHLVGTMGADGSTPLSGVEAAYESYLSQCGGRIYAALQKTAAGGLLDTEAVLVDDGYHEQSGVMLTLDARLQEILEQETAQMEAGAALLLRTDGSIAASVSRPSYEGGQVAELLSSTGGELLNRAFTGYNIGSLFKLVVAAQTLERGQQAPVYTCHGKIEVDGRGFSCHLKEGHGTLTMQQAMEKSCNVYFISLLLDQGREGYDAAIELAGALGFDSSSSLCPGVTEQAGTLPDEALSRQLMANVAIGQGSLLATPLDFAVLVCTIVNGGLRPEVRLVEGLLEEGELLRELGDEPRPVRVMSEQTAKALRDMMEQTCLRGTGTTARPEGFDVAGKTASAETGWLRGGESVVHGSFAGCFPADDPRYVLVVLVENGKSGSVAAAPIFREVAQRVMQPETQQGAQGAQGAQDVQDVQGVQGTQGTQEAQDVQGVQGTQDAQEAQEAQDVQEAQATAQAALQGVRATARRAGGQKKRRRSRGGRGRKNSAGAGLRPLPAAGCRLFGKKRRGGPARKAALRGPAPGGVPPRRALLRKGRAGALRVRAGGVRAGFCPRGGLTNVKICSILLLSFCKGRLPVRRAAPCGRKNNIIKKTAMKKRVSALARMQREGHPAERPFAHPAEKAALELRGKTATGRFRYRAF